MVVVSPLAIEAILGLHFLSKHGALIDLQQRKLHLDGFLLPLEINNRTTAHIGKDSTIPANSQMEVIAHVSGPVNEGAWLLEDVLNLGRHCRKNVAVARAVVNPRCREVPVRLLNLHSHPLTISKGTTLATLEPLYEDALAVCAVGSVAQEKDGDRNKMLDSIVKATADRLSSNEKDKFFSLLSTYSDIFAGTRSDLGRTILLKNTINTGTAELI